MRHPYVFAASVLGLSLLAAPLSTAAWVRFGIDAPQRGALAGRILSKLLPGHFSIASLGMEGIGQVHLRDVRITDPTDVLVATAAAIDGTFSWAPLLSGRVVFSDIVTEKPWVQVEEIAPQKPMRIETAFVTRPASDPRGAPQTPVVAGVRVELHNVAVHDADLTVHAGSIEVHATHLAIVGADYWVHGDGMALTTQLTTDLALHTPTITQQTHGLHIDAQDVRYLTAHRYDRVDAKRLDMQWPGAKVLIAGAFFIEAEEIKEDNAQVTFAFETAQPILRTVLAPEVMRDLHGSASGKVTLKEGSGRQHVALNLVGKNFGWRHIAVNTLVVQGGFKEGEAALDTLQLHSGSSDMSVSGAIAWMPGLHFGRHEIKVGGTHVELQKLLGPFVKHPGLLPETVTFTATSSGRSLWPMTSELHLDATAWGVPASWLPGVPDPIYLKGIALMHPDLVEILRIQIGSKEKQLALQGSLPFDHLGVVDVFTSLHRIPEKRVATQAED